LRRLQIEEIVVAKLLNLLGHTVWEMIQELAALPGLRGLLRSWLCAPICRCRLGVPELLFDRLAFLLQYLVELLPNVIQE
jgi:hypothetical protein